MLSDNLKMPLLRLTNYASKVDHAVSHLKMVFDSNDRSKVIAELSNLVERSELSNIQSESISGLFSSILKELKFNLDDLPLSEVIFEADLNLLGLDNQTMKITCRFNPKHYVSSGTSFFASLFDHISQYELNQTLEHSATNLILNLKRSQLDSVDVIFDNSIPNDNFYQIAFTDKVSKALEEIVTDYESHSYNIAPAICLNYALTQRRCLQFLTGKVQCRAKLVKDGNTFDLNSVQDVLAQTNIALNLAETAHICGINLVSHGRGYIPTFDLITKQSDLDTAVGTIDLNHEVAQTYQYIFKMMLRNYSYPDLAKSWSEHIGCDLKMRQGKFILDFRGYYLVKSFDEQSIDTVKTVMQAKMTLFKDKAQIKQIDLTTKNDKVLRARLKIDALDKKIGKVNGMHLTGVATDDPQAVITRTFRLSKNGYALEEERFTN